MPCGNLDATILVERPPDIEIIGGLVYVTDRIGSLTIRRCFRPHTFMLLVRAGKRVADEFFASESGKVFRLPRH
jgi:hypothetical protein